MNDKPLLASLRTADQDLAKLRVPHHLGQRLRWSMMRRAALRGEPKSRWGRVPFASLAIAALAAVALMTMVAWKVLRRPAVDPCLTLGAGGDMSLHGSCAVTLSA